VWLACTTSHWALTGIHCCMAVLFPLHAPPPKLYVVPLLRSCLCCLLYVYVASGCTPVAATEAILNLMQVRLSNLTALLQLSDGAAGATRWRPPAARVFRYSPHTVWLEDRPRVDAPAPEEERGNEDDAAERQRSGQTEESDSEESSDEQSDDDSSAEESDDGSDQLQHPAVVGKQLQHASPWALFVMAAAVQYDARPERPHHSTAHTRGELEGGGGGSAPPHAEAEHRHGVFCAHELPRGAVVCEVSGVGRQVCAASPCPCTGYSASCVATRRAEHLHGPLA
jgi:hypothetical protein